MSSNEFSAGSEGPDEIARDGMDLPAAGGPTVRPVEADIREVYLDRPWSWLAAGWNDLRRTPSIGLAFGIIYAVIGAALSYLVLVRQDYFLIFPLMAGFFLLGPLAAVGLYETSRRLDAGESVTLGDAISAFRQNPTQIALMGVVLLLIMIAWVRLATLVFFMFFSGNPPPPEPLPFLSAVLSLDALPFLIVGNLLGAFLAAMTFAISVMAIPVLLDRRDSHVIQAIAISWRAATRNVTTMALWAWLIVLFVGAGIATAFVGLIVTLPLIAHASWAAYRDTVHWPDRPDASE